MVYSDNNVEILCVDIVISKSKTRLLVDYITHSNNIQKSSMKYMHSPLRNNIILGDFYMRNVKLDTKYISFTEMYNKLYSFLTSHQPLFQFLLVITTEKKILDLIFFSNRDLITYVEYLLPLSDSDHVRFKFSFISEIAIEKFVQSSKNFQKGNNNLINNKYIYNKLGFS